MIVGNYMSLGLNYYHLLQFEFTEIFFISNYFSKQFDFDFSFFVSYLIPQPETLGDKNQTGLQNLKPQQWASGTFCLFRQDFVFLTKRNKPMIIIQSRHSKRFKFPVMHMLISCFPAHTALVMSYMYSLAFPQCDMYQINFNLS